MLACSTAADLQETEKVRCAGPFFHWENGAHGRTLSRAALCPLSAPPASPASSPAGNRSHLP